MEQWAPVVGFSGGLFEEREKEEEEEERTSGGPSVRERESERETREANDRHGTLAPFGAAPLWGA